jgi:hypothetical protein
MYLAATYGILRASLLSISLLITAHTIMLLLQPVIRTIKILCTINNRHHHGCSQGSYERANSSSSMLMISITNMIAL